ncbi:hypothetical protein Hanom_Chr05g00426661 [Helianthus anomalus]
MATSPHSNPEVVGSSLARSQCPYGSGFTPDSGLLGVGLRGGITSAVGRTVEYPPPPTIKTIKRRETKRKFTLYNINHILQYNLLVVFLFVNKVEHFGCFLLTLFFHMNGQYQIYRTT